MKVLNKPMTSYYFSILTVILWIWTLKPTLATTERTLDS